jgi:hypothetical protein
MGNPPIARRVPTRKTVQTQDKDTQASILLVGFEPTTPIFARMNTVHAPDHAVTVVGSDELLLEKNKHHKEKQRRVVWA